MAERQLWPSRRTGRNLAPGVSPTEMLIASGTLARDALAGETVVVIGAGHGIGFEAARSLLWLGANVAIAEIDEAARRGLYREVVDRLASEARLADASTAEAATDVVFAMTSWQLWEQLVVDGRWSKDDYRSRLEIALRRVLVEDGDRGAAR